MKRIHRHAFTRALTWAACFACSDASRVIDAPDDTTSGVSSGGSDEGAGEPDPNGSPGAGGAPQGASPAQPEGDAGAPNAGAAGSGSTDTGSTDTGLPSEADIGEPVTSERGFVAPRGPCGLAERVGAFSIEKQVDFGVVQGTVAEGVVPAAIPRIDGDDGTCKLLERRTLACIPACVGAETCGEGGACIPFPRQVSVGDVTISGLTRPTTMSPLAPNNAYFSPGADNPPYAVGSEIVLSAAGAGAQEAFQLFGVGSEPLHRAPSWQLAPGTDLSVAWDPPASAVQATVLVELDIDQHGASPLSLSCEFPDTGSAVIPRVTIDRLLGAGVSGFPNGRITRRTADHVDRLTGCVELVVGSPLAASVSIAGFTPCNGPDECPGGQTCNVALQRCE